MPALVLPRGAVAMPLKHFLEKGDSKPLALMGIVENGLIRPLDPSIVLPEQTRVIIVTVADLPIP